MLTGGYYLSPVAHIHNRKMVGMAAHTQADTHTCVINPPGLGQQVQTW